MRVIVMNRENARVYTHSISIPKTAIISITDVNAPINIFQANPKIPLILRLKFDDVEAGDINAITTSEADEIVSFLNSVVSDKTIEQIIVHCEGGVSRSAGVAAALMQILFNDDSEIFGNGHYCPNFTCYTYVLNAYYGGYDREAVDEKFRKNIELWKELNL